VAFFLSYSCRLLASCGAARPRFTGRWGEGGAEAIESIDLGGSAGPRLLNLDHFLFFSFATEVACRRRIRIASDVRDMRGKENF